MAPRRLTPRYFAVKPSGYYWLPGPHARALGFSNTTLPKDLAAAVKRAEELNAALDRARRGEEAKPPKVEGSIDSWLDKYEADDAFTDLAPKTQRGYRQCAADVRRWAGDLKPEAVTKPAIKAWYKVMFKATPAKANATIRFLRLFLEWCIGEGALAVNPAAKPKLKTIKGRTRVWTDEETVAFCAKAEELGRTSLKLAVLLGRNLGQREGDILKLADTARRVGHNGSKTVWLIKQSKTGAIVEVPETQMLAEAMTDRKQSGAFIVISEATGEPYNEDFFRHEMRRVAQAAGLPDDLLFMDLRRTTVLELARANNNALQIAQITGHTYKSVQTILETYLPRDSEIAAQAIAKLEDYRGRKRAGNAEV